MTTRLGESSMSHLMLVRYVRRGVVESAHVVCSIRACGSAIFRNSCILCTILRFEK